MLGFVVVSGDGGGFFLGGEGIGWLVLIFGGMWIWGRWIWKAVECFKWGLMGHPSRNMENIGAEGDLNSRTLAQRFWRRRILEYCIESF